MRVVALLLLSALVSCVPWVRWEPVSLDQKHETDKRLIIGPGDWVRLHSVNGGVYLLKVTDLVDDGFYGVTREDNKKKYHMRYANLESIDVLRGAVEPLEGEGPTLVPIQW